MYKKINMNIAVIPARGGSKRIPKKNIKLFNNKPIIYWSIKTAQDSKIFDKIIVTTDDKKIAKIANKFGAETPFLRKKTLAKNHISTVEVVRDAIIQLKKDNLKIDNVCCIYPAAPLISSKDIVKGYKKLRKSIDYVLCASTFPSSIHRAFDINKKIKKLKIIFPNKFDRCMDRNKKLYFDAGQFCWGSKSSWIKRKNVFKSRVDVVEIPRWRSQDINFIEDWITTQKLFKLKTIV